MARSSHPSRLAVRITYQGHLLAAGEAQKICRPRRMLLGTLIDGTEAGLGAAPTDDRVVDRETVQRMAEGDPAALALVYDRHIRAVFGLVMRVLQDQGDAEDVVQEVFAQAWSQAKRYDATRGSVAAWLLTIARSRAIDRLRSTRARPDSAPLPRDTAVVELPDPAVGAEGAVLTAESARRVRVALTALPLTQRLAIELAYFEGLTQTQIARQLEQPLGTVKTRIRTGLLKLREALTAHRHE